MLNYLIIGGSSGIGKQLALQLSNSGNQVYATYFKHDLSAENNSIHYHYLNVLDNTISLDFLPEVLDGIIYFPGSINLKPFERLKPDDFITDFNLTPHAS